MVFAYKGINIVCMCHKIVIFSGIKLAPSNNNNSQKDNCISSFLLFLLFLLLSVSMRVSAHDI